jgi:hypothetical protein
MVSIDQLLYLLPVVALSISLIYYGMNLRNASETRKIQLYWQVLGSIGTREFLTHYFVIIYDQEYESYEEWVEKYGPRTNREAYVSYYYVTRIYQCLAHLVREDVLPLEILAEQIRPRAIITLWETIQPVVRHHREHTNPKAFDDLEYLHNEMKALLVRRVADEDAMTVH